MHAQTVNLLLSLLPTLTSKSRRVWVSEPLLGIAADRGAVTTAAFPHLRLRSPPRRSYCLSEASYPTGTTEMLQSATKSGETLAFRSAIYVQMSHPPCLGNKIPLSRVLPGSFPGCAGKFCKRREKRQNAAVSEVRRGDLIVKGSRSEEKGNRGSIVLVVEVVYLGHVSEEDILPVPQHGRHEDEHGGVIHLGSVALRDAKRGSSLSW